MRISFISHAKKIPPSLTWRSFIILFIIIVSVLQTAVLAHFKFIGVSPNFILLALVFISLATNRRQALIAAIIGGLFLDFFSIFPFGIFTLTLAIISLLLNEAKFYLFARANFMVILLAVFFSTIFYYLFVVFLVEALVLVKLSAASIQLKEILFSVMPKEILYNLIIAVAVFVFLKSIKRPVVI